uniref:Methyltransferase-like protein 5 n=1 Tax=Romanomermis culicivorax TaxID=13658 RepID=A0A915HZ37_ROMCU
KILYTIHSDFDDIEKKIIGDLGCGCGTFLAGCSALRASHGIGFDIDEDALAVSATNLRDLELDPSTSLLRCDATTSFLTPNCKLDVVITNPPFGTKNNQGIDMKFVKFASSIAREAIYSLHKTSTREFIMKKACQELKLDAEIIAELKFDLPKTMKFHSRNVVDIDVDLIRFVHI